MTSRLSAFCIISVLVGSTAVQAQQPKKASGELLATFVFGDLAGDSSGLWSRSGAHTYKDGEHLYVWTILVKDEQGRHLLFPAPKSYRITANGKDANLEGGSKIAITFSPNNPLLVESVDIREVGKDGIKPDVYELGIFGGLKDNFLLYEVRSGLRKAARLDKDTTITVGRNTITAEDIQPGQEIVLTRDKGKLLAITMLPDDTARLKSLTNLGLGATHKLASPGGLDVVLRSGFGTQFVRPELFQKMVKDLKGMPNLQALSVGRQGTQVKTKLPPNAMSEATWVKAAEQLQKLQSPFALDINVDVPVDDTSALAELQNLEALTLHDYGDDFAATLKKMPNLKSLTIEIDSDADLAKVIDHPALTGLVLGADSNRKFAVSDAGMKQLKKATRLTHLTFASGNKVTAAGFKELEGLRSLRSLTVSATGVKEARKNQGIKALTLTDATDEALKDACDIKGLQELRLTYARVTDAGLRSLKNLKDLKKLQLEASAVTGAGLRELQALKSLTSLELQIKLSDDGMAELKNLASVRHLKLRTFSAVTDAGFAQLKDMKDLESLDLRASKITDAGLEHLKNLKKLTWLQLPFNPGTPNAPGISFKAVEEFEKAMPKCEYGVVGSGTGSYSRLSKNFRTIPSPF